jgi:hypothetical protein
MHSAQRHRNRAAQARRLARTSYDPELEQRLEALAREYDAIAQRMEQVGGKKPELH